MAARAGAAEIAVAALVIDFGPRELAALAELVENRPGPPMEMGVDDVHGALLPKRLEFTVILVIGGWRVNAIWRSVPARRCMAFAARHLPQVILDQHAAAGLCTMKLSVADSIDAGRLPSSTDEWRGRYSPRP